MNFDLEENIQLQESLISQLSESNNQQIDNGTNQHQQMHFESQQQCENKVTQDNLNCMSNYSVKQIQEITIKKKLRQYQNHKIDTSSNLDSINDNNKNNDDDDNNNNNNNETDDNIDRFEIYLLFKNKYSDVRFNLNQITRQFTIRKYVSDEDQQEFDKEIKILQDLKNYNITLPLIEYGQENDRLFFEQVSGQKDFQMVKNSYSLQLNSNKMKQYQIIGDFFTHHFFKLFQKLTKLHELGYAHSDIKPQNIVLGYDKEAYFIDFGGAVKLQEYQSYLDQFTPLYNMQTYYEIINKNGQISYKRNIFRSESEVKLCEFTQLALTFIFMICFEQQQMNDFKNKNINTILRYLSFYNINMIRICSRILNEADPTIEIIGESLIQEIPLVVDYNSILMMDSDIFDMFYNKQKEKFEVKGINKYNIYLLDMLDQVFNGIKLNPSQMIIHPLPDIKQYISLCSKHQEFNQYYLNLQEGTIYTSIDIFNLCQDIILAKNTTYNLNINQIGQGDYFYQILDSLKSAMFLETLSFNITFNVRNKKDVLDELLKLLCVSYVAINYPEITLKMEHKSKTQQSILISFSAEQETIDQVFTNEMINQIAINSTNKPIIQRLYSFNFIKKRDQSSKLFSEFLIQFSKKDKINSNFYQNSYDLIFIQNNMRNNFNNTRFDYEDDDDLDVKIKEFTGNRQKFGNFLEFVQYNKQNLNNPSEYKNHDSDYRIFQHLKDNIKQESQVSIKNNQKVIELENFIKSIQNLLQQQNIQLDLLEHVQLQIGIFNTSIDSISCLESILELSQQFEKIIFFIEFYNCNLSEVFQQEVKQYGEITNQDIFDHKLKDVISNSKSNYILDSKSNYVICFKSQIIKQEVDHSKIFFKIENFNPQNQANKAKQLTNKSQLATEDSKSYEGIDKKCLIELLSQNDSIDRDYMIEINDRISNQSFQYTNGIIYKNKSFVGDKLEDIQTIIKLLKNQNYFTHIELDIRNVPFHFINAECYRGDKIQFTYEDNILYTKEDNEIQEYQKIIQQYFELYFYLIKKQSLQKTKLIFKCANSECYTRQFKVKQNENQINISTKYIIKKNKEFCYKVLLLKAPNIRQIYLEELKKQERKYDILKSKLIIEFEYSIRSNSDELKSITESFYNEKDQQIIIKVSSEQSDCTFLQDMCNTLQGVQQTQMIIFNYCNLTSSQETIIKSIDSVLNNNKNNVNTLVFEFKKYRIFDFKFNKDLINQIMTNNPDYTQNKEIPYYHFQILV